MPPLVYSQAPQAEADARWMDVAPSEERSHSDLHSDPPPKAALAPRALYLLCGLGAFALLALVAFLLQHYAAEAQLPRQLRLRALESQAAAAHLRAQQLLAEVQALHTAQAWGALALAQGGAADIRAQGLKPRLGWLQKNFTAPLPDPLPRAPMTPAQVDAQLDGWTAELEKLIEEEKGRIEPAARRFLPADKLPLGAMPLHLVDQAVILIDGRKDPQLLWTLKNTLFLLGPGWGCVVFVDDGNWEWFVQGLEVWPGGAGQHVVLQRLRQASYAQVNSVPLSRQFFDVIDCETVLLVQPDGLMVRSPYWGNAEDRAEWDHLLSSYVYLGAPWKVASPDPARHPFARFGGNGGVSLRKSSAMKLLSIRLDCDHDDCKWDNLYRTYDKDTLEGDHEDGFVQKGLYKHRATFGARIPHWEEAARFSLETHLPGPDQRPANPFFFHAIWKVHSRDKFIRLIAKAKQYYYNAGVI